jgi:hypothetical protein
MKAPQVRGRKIGGRGLTKNPRNPLIPIWYPISMGSSCPRSCPSLAWSGYGHSSTEINSQEIGPGPKSNGGSFSPACNDSAGHQDVSFDAARAVFKNRKDIALKPIRKHSTIIALLISSFALPVLAQTPAILTTPDKVKTLIGTLEYKDGAPSASTVQKVVSVALLDMLISDVYTSLYIGV